ncbi:MAG: hypothetical protein ABIL18_07150 [candidate division WOR-3 bacterium]
MKAITRIMAILLIAGLIIPGLILAKGKGITEKNDAEKKEVVKLKYVNIQDQIDPNFNFLADIGAMIDNARQLKDGNGLVAASLLLFYAEKVSGKKAKEITAEALLNEASELAKEQKNAALAKSVADLWADAVFGPGNKAKADEFTKLAKDYEALASGTRGYGLVIINNNTPFYLYIYIDGNYRGTLYSNNTGYYLVWEGYTKLYAEAPYTEPYNWYWGPKYIDLGEDQTYTWNLVFTR